MEMEEKTKEKVNNIKKMTEVSMLGKRREMD